MSDEPLTLARLNGSSHKEFAALLAGTYEHSPWVVERAWPRGPFATLAQLKRTLVEIVSEAERDEQLALLRAHPELAGKAMAAGTMTAESKHEQGSVGLTACTADELAKIARLNRAYRERFGFPFMLAVRGPRGSGLAKAQIIATFERRLENHPDFEFAEALRNVHRVAELRLDDRFAAPPRLGVQAWDCAELLARHSDPGFAESGQLTVTYLTDAHRACAAQLVRWMRECGFDEVKIDAVGNVVGLYRGESGAAAPRLLTGSHYDTVRNGGRYDGRLGIFVPMICVRELKQRSRRLPFAIELVAFAEEEGQRYKATFLGSGALIGQFDRRWLEQRDADGVPMKEAMRHAGLPASPRAIAALKRDPARYLGFVEVHIEQGPVLNELGLPLGIVTSINGGVRFAGEVRGMASHAGTTPMTSRRDAAAAVAELAVFLERRARAAANVVGTMGMLEVPNGSTNVVPGRCRFTLDIRATTDPVRDACVADVLAEAEAICAAARRRALARGDNARRCRAVGTRVAGALGARRRRRSACRCTACRAAPATTR